MHALSRLIDRISLLSGHPLASLAAVLVCLGDLALGAVLSWSQVWLNGNGAGTGLVSIVLLFMLQHSTSRGDLALQVKLDALLFALQEAKNDLAGLEEQDEAAIRAAQRALHADITAATDDCSC